MSQASPPRGTLEPCFLPVESERTTSIPSSGKVSEFRPTNRASPPDQYDPIVRGGSPPVVSSRVNGRVPTPRNRPSPENSSHRPRHHGGSAIWNVCTGGLRYTSMSHITTLPVSSTAAARKPSGAKATP